MAGFVAGSSIDREARKNEAERKVKEFQEKSEKAFSIFTMVTNLIVATVGMVIKSL